MGRTARAGDDDAQSAFAGSLGVFEKQVGSAMGADYARLMGNPQRAQKLDGCGQRFIVTFAAHHHANQRPLVHGADYTSAHWSAETIASNEGQRGDFAREKLVMVPRLHCYLNDRQQHAKCGKKALGTLPVLLVALHAVLELSYASAVAVPHESSHLRLEYA